MRGSGLLREVVKWGGGYWVRKVKEIQGRPRIGN